MLEVLLNIEFCWDVRLCRWVLRPFER